MNITCLIIYNRKGLHDELAMISEMDKVNTCYKHVGIKFSAESLSAGTQHQNMWVPNNLKVFAIIWEQENKRLNRTSKNLIRKPMPEGG